MGLNIKNARAEEAIRELADLTGETMTSAIELAARERIERILTERRTAKPKRTALVADDIAALRELARSSGMTRRRIDNELYDEQGVFR